MMIHTARGGSVSVWLIYLDIKYQIYNIKEKMFQHKLIRATQVHYALFHFGIFHSRLIHVAVRTRSVRGRRMTNNVHYLKLQRI